MKNEKKCKDYRIKEQDWILFRFCRYIEPIQFRFLRTARYDRSSKSRNIPTIVLLGKLRPEIASRARQLHIPVQNQRHERKGRCSTEGGKARGDWETERNAIEFINPPQFSPLLPVNYTLII